MAIEPIYSMRLSHVVSALSLALDITEGQPEGHATRSCMIGMRVAREFGLPHELESPLFYALLLKDLGCSSNASKVCYLFGNDDHQVKEDLKTTHWTSFTASAGYVARNVMPEGNWLQRLTRMLFVVKQGQSAARELVEIRCDRGATYKKQDVNNMPPGTCPRATF